MLLQSASPRHLPSEILMFYLLFLNLKVNTEFLKPGQCYRFPVGWFQYFQFEFTKHQNASARNLMKSQGIDF